jgi:uncharacterized protein YhhL (DUF1145 family)
VSYSSFKERPLSPPPLIPCWQGRLVGMAPKIVTGLVWLYCALAFVAPVPQAGIAQGVFLFMLVAHAVECVVFLPRIRAAGGSLGHHITQVMLFGVVHARTLPKADSA